MKKLKMKFRSKMLLWIIGAIVVISGVVQYYINHETSKMVLNLEEKSLAARVFGIKTCIEDNLDSDKTLAEVLTKKNDIIQGLEKNNKEKLDNYGKYLAEIVGENKQIEIAIVANKDGEIVSTSNPAALGMTIADRGYFKDALKGKTVISDAVRSKLTDDVIFGVSSPIKNGEEVLGVLFVANRVAYMYDKLIRPVKIGKTGYGYITNKDVLMLAHPNEKLILNEDVIKSSFMAPVVKKMLKVRNGIVRYWFEPAKAYKIAEMAELSNGWFIFYVVNEDELLESLDETRILILSSAIILILGIGLVVYILIGSVAKVLKVLNELMNDLAVGRITKLDEQEVEVKKALVRNDEFGEMTQSVLGLQEYFKDMSEVATKVAEKDLNIKLKVRGKDDILGHSIEQMVSNFNEALTQVSLSVNQVSQGANQVSSASQELSAGAIQQVSYIEKISNSVNNLQVKTNTNADNASTANNHATEANGAARKGQEQMESLSKAMQSMSGRASEVQKIIKTIDDIAFQTNLLALNAAVEAARAGAHGKGFAVVAEEVRNLAARSAKAAGETAELIENVVSEIDNGNNMTEVTAESLNSIAEGISQASDLVAEITASMIEQTDGMKEISSVLEQIEQVTQSNSASSEETASASEEMSGMSHELKKLVSEFKLMGTVIKEPVKKIKHNIKKPSPKSNKEILPLENEAEIIQPTDEIKLDDSEFGKF